MIRITNLRKSFGSLLAVDGVSFEIPPGETFGLLGPNGAGKTTTINMLAGLLRPEAGSIEINGAADPGRAEVRRGLGVAPQALSLYGELTGQENVAFFGRMYGLAGERLKERVDWALDFAGLTSRRKDRVRTYSGGMQRRLNLACALVHDPETIFLDEPTAGVDPQSRNFIFENIEALKARGRTILYTTHYMEEAQRLCDRVAIMDHGRVLALDTVPGLIAAHGGSSVVEVEFDRPPADTSALPGKLEGTRVRFEAKEPLPALARLGTCGAGFLHLQVQQPDLETVFLALTGRRLRD